MCTHLGLKGDCTPESCSKVKRGNEKVRLMEQRVKERRTGLIKLRVSEEELATIRAHQKKSTDRNLSQYLRKLAMGKPITVKVRNASADDFLRDMVLLKTALEEVCAQYEKATLRLKVLEKIPEFRSWLLLYDTSRLQLLEQVTRIDQRITQLYEQWLQK